MYLGLKGHTLGWQNRRFEGGVAQYLEVQRKWTTWGVAVLVLSIVVGALSGLGAGLAGHGVAR